MGGHFAEGKAYVSVDLAYSGLRQRPELVAGRGVEMARCIYLRGEPAMEGALMITVAPSWNAMQSAGICFGLTAT